jgi:hypothetical protein
MKLNQNEEMQPLFHQKLRILKNPKRPKVLNG